MNLKAVQKCDQTDKEAGLLTGGGYDNLLTGGGYDRLLTGSGYDRLQIQIGFSVCDINEK